MESAPALKLSQHDDVLITPIRAAAATRAAPPQALFQERGSLRRSKSYTDGLPSLGRVPAYLPLFACAPDIQPLEPVVQRFDSVTRNTTSQQKRLRGRESRPVPIYYRPEELATRPELRFTEFKSQSPPPQPLCPVPTVWTLKDLLETNSETTTDSDSEYKDDTTDSELPARPRPLSYSKSVINLKDDHPDALRSNPSSWEFIKLDTKVHLDLSLKDWMAERNKRPSSTLNKRLSSRVCRSAPELSRPLSRIEEADEPVNLVPGSIDPVFGPVDEAGKVELPDMAVNVPGLNGKPVPRIVVDEASDYSSDNTIVPRRPRFDPESLVPMGDWEERRGALRAWLCF